MSSKKNRLRAEKIGQLINTSNDNLIDNFCKHDQEIINVLTQAFNEMKDCVKSPPPKLETMNEVVNGAAEDFCACVVEW